jgi:hypothetical protein
VSSLVLLLFSQSLLLACLLAAPDRATVALPGRNVTINVTDIRITKRTNDGARAYVRAPVVVAVVQSVVLSFSFCFVFVFVCLFLLYARVRVRGSGRYDSVLAVVDACSTRDGAVCWGGGGG